VPAIEIKASEVQKLRQTTGAGLMDCKKALDESAGDFDKAILLLKEKGLGKAARKAGRSTTAGIVDSYIHNNRVGVLLELFCETDFVAKTAEFKELAHEISMQIAAMAPSNLEELMAQQSIRDEGSTIKDLLMVLQVKPPKTPKNT